LVVVVGETKMEDPLRLPGCHKYEAAPVAVNVLFDPSQITDWLAVTTATGSGYMVSRAVAAELHPLLLSVNIKDAVPSEIPVTIPALFTVAMVALLLTHEPPVTGLNVLVMPTQMADAPVMDAVGKGVTVTSIIFDAVLPHELVVVTK
jgi:hypothetical protein